MWESRESRRRGWIVFVIWLGVAGFCAYVDHARGSTVALPVFLVISVTAVYFGFRGQRPSRFKFEVLENESRAVRSRTMGFEVRILADQIEYRHDDKVFSLKPQPTAGTRTEFGLNLRPDARWNAPFDSELISENNKRKEISGAIIAAVGFIQGNELGRRRRKSS